MEGNISTDGTIDPRTKIIHEQCYSCSTNGTDLLFGSLKNRYKRNEPRHPKENKGNKESSLI